MVRLRNRGRKKEVKRGIEGRGKLERKKRRETELKREMESKGEPFKPTSLE